MTREYIVKRTFHKLRTSHDYDIYIKDGIISNYQNSIFLYCIIIFFYILGKTEVINFPVAKTIPIGFIVFLSALIPYSIYRIYANKDVKYEYFNPKLYTDEELRNIVINGNRIRRNVEKFVDNFGPKTWILEDVLIIIGTIYSFFRSYKSGKISNNIELILISSIILIFSTILLINKRRASRDFYKLQKMPHVKVRNIIVDALALSPLNPYLYVLRKDIGRIGKKRTRHNR